MIEAPVSDRVHTWSFESGGFMDNYRTNLGRQNYSIDQLRDRRPWNLCCYKPDTLLRNSFIGQRLVSYI